MLTIAEVQIYRHERVGELVINRPDAGNLLTPEVLLGLRDGLAELVAEDSVGAVVLRGEGPDFCRGLDLEALAGGNGLRANAELRTQLCAQLLSCPKPVVTALAGQAVAGGAALALSADLVVAEIDAQLQVPEVAIDMVAWMNIAILALKLGEARTLEIALTAQSFHGPEMREMGLVCQVVPTGDAEAVCRRLANRLADFHGPSLARTKALTRAVQGVEDVHAYLRAASEANARLAAADR